MSNTSVAVDDRPVPKIVQRHANLASTPMWGKRAVPAAVRPVVVATPPVERQPYTRGAVIEMTAADWLGVPSNPRQRDEQVRIEKNRIDHLLTFDETHREVAMGILPDGRRYKVDGHTRAAVWRLGLVQPPKSLFVTTYMCADESAVEQLYDRYDSSFATETGTDRVTGAFREAGICPKSPMLREGGISTAARSLYHFIMHTAPDKKTKSLAINECVKLFSKEIMLLDSIPPTRALFPTGIVMGALLTLGNNPTQGVKFWNAYASDSGWKDGGRVDAVQALRERLDKLRGKSAGVRDTALMNYSVAAFRGYQKRTTYSTKHLLQEMSKDLLRKYAAEVLEAKVGS